jgi:hypothetical protein
MASGAFDKVKQKASRLVYIAPFLLTFFIHLNVTSVKSRFPYTTKALLSF